MWKLKIKIEALYCVRLSTMYYSSHSKSFFLSRYLSKPGTLWKSRSHLYLTAQEANMKSFTAAGKSTHRSLRLISSRCGASSKSRRTAALKERHWENLHLTETSESVSESHRVVISDWDSVRRSVCLGSLKINVGDFKLKKEEDEKDTISEMRDGPYSSFLCHWWKFRRISCSLETKI